MVKVTAYQALVQPHLECAKPGVLILRRILRPLKRFRVKQQDSAKAKIDKETWTVQQLQEFLKIWGGQYFNSEGNIHSLAIMYKITNKLIGISSRRNTSAHYNRQTIDHNKKYMYGNLEYCAGLEFTTSNRALHPSMSWHIGLLHNIDFVNQNQNFSKS